MHALHLASVTAVLKHRLENGLVECGIPGAIGGDVIVSTLPPDRIAVTSEERAQLNLFLYQAAPQTGLTGTGWRRSDDSGRTPLMPPLSLELFYLLYFCKSVAQDVNKKIMKEALKLYLY